jgi:hypothetical protein
MKTTSANVAASRTVRHNAVFEVSRCIVTLHYM